MSQIDKLLIRGIRSFDPNVANVIEFYTPLTIIIGHNGAGKTTIIECLKYATTGATPPNSKNGAFIHDPKLAHETEVKAQVKLRFKNVNRREMVCTRSMSLTQTKKGVQQKTLESVLLTKDPETGENHSLSTKCAELDAELPLQLGVSAPILDNVIFCHQEESFWPLSEPSVLKKKFDEIFASTRYTKALDNIKTLRKEQVIQLKLSEKDLDNLKANKAKAERVREELSTVESKLSHAQERIESLDGGEIAETVEQMEGLMKQQEMVQKLFLNIKQSTMERDMRQKTMEELKANLQEYQESDAELKELLAEYEQSLDSKQSEQLVIEQKIAGLTEELTNLQAEQQAQLTTKGRLEAERKAYDSRLQEREALVKNLIAEHKFTGFNSTNVSAGDIERFTRKLRSDIEARKSDLDAAKGENRRKENLMMNEIQRLKTEMASVEETKKMTRRQIDAHRTKISGHMKNMQDMRITRADIDELERTLKDQEFQLDAARREMDLNNTDAKQHKLNQEAQALEITSKQLSEEMIMLSAQGESRARLCMKKSEQERKQEALTRTMSSAEADFQVLLRHKPAPHLMEGEVDKLLSDKQNSVRHIEEQVERDNRKLASVETQIGMARNNLTRKTSELNDRLSRVKAVTGDDNFNTAVARIEESVIEKRDELASMRSAGSMYVKFIKKYKDNGCCPLCVRGFERSEGEKFATKLQAILDRIPEASKAAEIDLADVEKKRSALLNLRTDWDDAERLEKVEIPEIRKRLAEYESEKDKLLSEIEDNNSTLAVLSLEKDEAASLHRKVQDILKQQKEIENLNSEVETIQGSLSANLRRDIHRLESERSLKQTELQTLEKRVRDVREQLQKSNFQFLKREELQNAIVELKSEIEQLQREIEGADAMAAERLPIVREKEGELSLCRKHSNRVEEEHGRGISALQHSMLQLESVNTDITRYMEQGGEHLLGRCISDLQSAEKRISQAQETIAALTEEMQVIRDQRADVRNLRRQIDDNLKYRTLKRDCATLERKIVDLEQRVAESNQGSVTNQYNRLKQKHERLVGERAGLVGESKQMQEQVRRLQRELQGDYRDIEEKYRKQLIDLKTEEMANHDLEKYAKALDNAIMKYHSMKMDEINKIIRELWVNTYQGNDIDTIEIRSDNENVTGNRQYNYRVVMLKGDTTLDMRGRCSAGQKVLTSLIIRLALAETFCLNCGILALDEPTTNLDRDNIESLAESLANIINLRRQQANFQLLIITHDEEFMHLLGKSEYADYYWRVSKDEDGHSVITRQAIVEG
ncbi:AAA domain-containing protein [Powellomyces hirtus]|nr:AAA domain-containing protein [Powellomyces hirtus]